MLPMVWRTFCLYLQGSRRRMEMGTS